MDSVLRGAATFFFLMLVFRISGKRLLADITTFDALLLLIISEATQQAMIDNDSSMTNAFLLILTLVGLNILMQQLSTRSQRVDKVLNGVPLILVEDGHVHQDRMKKVRVTEDDILEQGRVLLGVERMDQVEYAILERSGGITVIPKHVAWANPAQNSKPAEVAR